MRNYKDLQVWAKAHQFTLAAHKLTVKFPDEERYGLTSQIRRAAVSMGANLAEGCGRQCAGDFARYVQIALGSATEVSYHLLVARDLHYLNEAEHGALSSQLGEIMRMLSALLQTVRRGNGTERLSHAQSAAAGATKS